MRRTLLAALAISAAAIALPAVASAHGVSRSSSAGHERIHHHRRHHHAHVVRFASRSSASSTAPTSPPTSPTGEGVGTIASFEGGVLKITLNDGTTVSGTVTEATRIDCGCPAAMVADHGGGPGPSSSSGREDGRDHDQGDDGDDRGDEHQGQGCTTTASLLVSVKVREAELKLSAGQATWESIELAH